MADYLLPFYTKIHAVIKKQYREEYKALSRKGELPHPDLTMDEYINSKYPEGTFKGIGWIGVIFIAPLIIAYIMLILDFWRGKD